jgi:hypothetical protein
MAHHRGITAGSVVGLTVCAGLVMAPAALARPDMRPAPSARIDAAFPAHYMSAITAPSKNSLWAFGYSASSTSRAASWHWNGHEWSQAAIPGVHAGIGCAGSSSATNTWAVGTVGANPRAAAFRLKDGRWTLQAKLGTGVTTGCAVIGTADVWIFGTADLASGPYTGAGTWHWNGKTWKHITTHGYTLDTASAVSPDDIWATAQLPLAQHYQPAIARWNGHQWVPSKSFTRALPKPGSYQSIFSGPITALSASNVWTDVEVYNAGKATQLVLHWNGHSWLAAGSKTPGYYLAGAVPDGHGGWWSAGYSPPAAHTKPYLLHRIGNRWIRVAIQIPHGDAMYVDGNYTGSLLVHVPATQTALFVDDLATRQDRETGVVVGNEGLPR